jgi:hypothetical protein
MSEEKYVIVTAISSFRMRYCIPVSELQAMNPDAEVDPENWAMDAVTMEEAEEFSQIHMGETIVDTQVVSEDAMLSLFDKDNDYLSSWTKEKKIDFVRNWKSKTLTQWE